MRVTQSNKVNRLSRNITDYSFGMDIIQMITTRLNMKKVNGDNIYSITSSALTVTPPPTSLVSGKSLALLSSVSMSLARALM